MVGLSVIGGTVNTQSLYNSLLHEAAADSSFPFAIGVPQLFARLKGYNTALPKSCADIYLKPEEVAA